MNLYFFVTHCCCPVLFAQVVLYLWRRVRMRSEKIGKQRTRRQEKMEQIRKKSCMKVTFARDLNDGNAINFSPSLPLFILFTFLILWCSVHFLSSHRLFLTRLVLYVWGWGREPCSMGMYLLPFFLSSSLSTATFLVHLYIFFVLFLFFLSSLYSRLFQDKFLTRNTRELSVEQITIAVLLTFLPPYLFVTEY